MISVLTLKNLREVVFGAEDGVISVLVVTTALAIGGAGTAYVLLAGVATSAAGMVSMGAGAYLGSRAEQDAIGLKVSLSNPLKDGIVMAVSFLLASTIPLGPFVLLGATDYASGLAVVVSLLSLFSLGTAKGILVRKSMWRQGLEIMMVGALSAACGFAVGELAPTI